MKPKKNANKARLTATVVAKLKHAGKGRRTIVWDDRQGPNWVRGFCVFLYKTGEKTFFVRLPDPSSKSRYRFVRLGHVDQISLEQARLMALKAWDDYRLGRRPASSDGVSTVLTVSQAATRFLGEYRTGRNGNAIQDHPAWKCNMRRLTDAVGSKPMESVGTGDLQPVIEELTAGTARRVKSNWSTFWDYAISQAWIPNRPNPLRAVELGGCKARTWTKAKKKISDDDIAAMIAEAEKDSDPVFPLYLRLLAMTGCRPGETLRARWDEQSDAGQIYLPKKRIIDGREKNTNKTGKELRYPLQPTSEVANVVADLRALTGSMDGMFCATPDDFTATAKLAKRYSQRFKAIQAKLGIDAGYTPSHFRSTDFTAAYERHLAALEHAAKHAQHSDSKTTADSYIAH